MRVLALGIVLAGLCAYLAHYWIIADREFDSYAGVETGMKLAKAKRTLKAKGWRTFDGGSVSKPLIGRRLRVCGEGYATLFIEGQSPDYTLVLHTNDDCEITKIQRRTRHLEL